MRGWLWVPGADRTHVMAGNLGPRPAFPTHLPLFAPNPTKKSNAVFSGGPRSA
jgi:hypothetical protein